MSKRWEEGGRLQHVDIERSSAPSTRRYMSTTAASKFVPPLFYYLCICVTTAGMGFTIYVAMTSHDSDCLEYTFMNNRYFSLILPSFHILYSLALRNIPMRSDHYYFSLFGFLGGVSYFVLSIYLVFKTWKCSNLSEKIDVISCIFSSFLWVMIWIYVSLTCFYLKFLRENPLQLLLFLRCVCIPPEVKKFFLILPYGVTSSIILYVVDQLRQHHCSIPLLNFSMISAVNILLIGIVVSLILFFGREHAILQADVEESESGYERGMDLTTDSSASAEELLRAVNHAPKTCDWLSLKVLFRAAGVLHIFAFVWASVGGIWYCFFPVVQCDVEVKQVAVASEASLVFFFIMDLVVAYIFKIESCFPSILKSEPFHSPFVEKGLKLLKAKIENTKRKPSSSKTATTYSRVMNIES